jgi:hypothetical protein
MASLSRGSCGMLLTRSIVATSLICDLQLLTRLSSSSMMQQESLKGFVCYKVDDSLICGTAEFLRQEEINSVAFPSKGRTMVTETPVEFNGSV